MCTVNRNHYILPLAWIIVAVFARLFPHLPNVSPLLSLCLFAGAYLPRRLAFSITLVVLLLSDFLLAKLYGYAMFGGWSLFVYSGFAATVGVGLLLAKNKAKIRLVCFLISSSLSFWLWTNFGMWLITAAYPKSPAGLITCYTVALPFLRNSLLGDLGWMLIIFGSYQLTQKAVTYYRDHPTMKLG